MFAAIVGIIFTFSFFIILTCVWKNRDRKAQVRQLMGLNVYVPGPEAQSSLKVGYSRDPKDVSVDEIQNDRRNHS